MKTQRTTSPPYYFIVVTLVAITLLASTTQAQQPSSYFSSPLPQPQATHPSTDPQQNPSIIPDVATPVPNPCAGFTDVAASDYDCPAVQFMTSQGYITGFTSAQCAAANLSWPCFRPGISVTRAQFVVIIGRTYHWPTNEHPNSNCSFSDVSTGYYAYGYIVAACNRSVVMGYPDHTFRPENLVLRSEASAFLVRAATTNGIPYPYFAPSSSSFTDVPTNHWAYQYIETLDENSIIVQDGGSFSPDTPTIRGDVAVFVWRTVVPAPLGQVLTFTQERSPYSGVRANRNTPTGNNVTHFAAGPVGTSNNDPNFTSLAFVEVGPSSNLYDIYGDGGGLHPYIASKSAGGGYNNTVMTTIALSSDPNVFSQYYVTDLASGYWNGYYCYPNTYNCVKVGGTSYVGADSLPLAAAGAETSNQAIPLGSSDVQVAAYTTANPQSTYNWCYNPSLTVNNVGGLIGQCISYSWQMQW